jgi:hypothetical protein
VAFEDGRSTVAIESILLGGFNPTPSEKYDIVSWDFDIPN